MRLLSTVLLFSTCVLAVEQPPPAAPAAVPLLELSGDGQAPLPPDLRTRWTARVAAAAAWAGLPALPLATTSNSQFCAWAMPRAGDHPPAPVLTGWWEGSEAPAAELAALAQDWPGYQVTCTPTRVSMAWGEFALSRPQVEPGLHATVHGAGLAASLAPLLLPEVRARLASWLAMLPAWRAQVRIAPDGTAELRTGIPAAALTPLAADAVAALPERAQALAAIAFAAGAEDLGLAPGTVIAAWLGGKDWVLSFPDHPLVRQFLADWAAQPLPELAAEAPPQALRKDGPVLARRAGRWYVASSLAAAATDEPGARWWGTPAPGTLGMVRIRLPERSTPEAELPKSAIGAWFMDRLVPTQVFALGGVESWPLQGLGDVCGQAVHGVTVQSSTTPDSEVVATFTGEVLPWLLPALAVRWASDEIGDQVGSRRLRAALAAAGAAGVTLTREQLLATLPPVSVAEAAAIEQHWQALGEAPPLAQVKVLNQRLVDTPLPLRLLRAEELAAAGGYVAKALPLLQKVQDYAAVPWLLTPPARNPAEVRLPHLDWWRGLNRCSEQLVLHGDASGLTALDALVRHNPGPATVIEVLMVLQMHAIRDHAWLAACIQGLGDPSAWLAEASLPVAQLFAAGQRGDVLVQAWFARDWLQHGSHPLLLGDDRAFAAADLAEFIAPDHRLSTEPPSTTALPLRSLVARNIQPALASVYSRLSQGRLNGQFIRLAARLVLLARTQELPADVAEVERLVGQPLAIAVDGVRVACRWQRLSPRGSRLALDPASPVPPGIRAQDWQRQCETAPPDDQAAFVRRLGLVQINQAAAKSAPNF